MNSTTTLAKNKVNLENFQEQEEDSVSSLVKDSDVVDRNVTWVIQKGNKNSLMTIDTSEGFKNYLSQGLNMSQITKEEYYKQLSPEEKTFYNSLTEEEQDLCFELDTTSLGEKVQNSLDLSLKEIEESKKIIKSINSGFFPFKF